MGVSHSILEAKVSWFKDYNSPYPAGETTLLQWLTVSKLKEQVLAIRNAPDKEKADLMKAELPAITPSGTFSYRKDASLITHSGFICIDIDLKGNERIRNYAQLKEQLSNIKQVAYCGLSVSGNGYFALIPIAYPEKHLQQFYALETAFSKLGIKVDEKCKNLSRLRGYSWDPAPYINHDALPFTGVGEKPTTASRTHFNRSTAYPVLNRSLGSNAEKVEQLLQKIEGAKLDLTENYNTWFAIACNFASTFGEAGRAYFHRVSSFHPEYAPLACDFKYNEALKKMLNNGPNLGAFVNSCKAAGLFPTIKINPTPIQKALPKPPEKADYLATAKHLSANMPSKPQFLPLSKPEFLEPEPQEIPIYIKQLELQLKSLPRPLPELVISPCEKILDPEKFIHTHLATIKHNLGNRTFNPFLSRLELYISNCFKINQL